MAFPGDHVYKVVLSGTRVEQKLLLKELKLHIKKNGLVDLADVAKYFEALSIVMDTNDATLQALAFSLVCYLVRRVSFEDKSGSVLRAQSFLVLPLLVTRIADPRVAVKVSAQGALEAYWLCCPTEVELALMEIGLGNRNPLLVNESVAWLNHILTAVNPHLNLDSFLAPLARCLAKHSQDALLVANIRTLFENYYDIPQNRIHKYNLQRALEDNRVSTSIRMSIMGTDLLMTRPASHSVRPAAATPRLLSPVPPKGYRSTQPANITVEQETRAVKEEPQTSGPKQLFHDTPCEPGALQELHSLLATLPNYTQGSLIPPLKVLSVSEIHHYASDMMPHFENKETERNWALREKSIVKLRSLLYGVSGTQHAEDYLATIRDLSEGICKGLLSLRTTLAVNSCQFLKELPMHFGTQFDPLVDLYMPTLLKLCSSTKSMTSTNAHVAISSIMAHCTLTPKLANRILASATDKSANIRVFAPFWLQIYIIRSHSTWDGTGLDVADKSLEKLLPNPNMQVREAAKHAYWKYYQHAQSLALALAQRLDQNTLRALERSKPEHIKHSISDSSSGRASAKATFIGRTKEAIGKPAVSRSASRTGYTADHRSSLDHVFSTMSGGVSRSTSLRSINKPTKTESSDDPKPAEVSNIGRRDSLSRRIDDNEPHYAQSTFLQQAASSAMSPRMNRTASLKRQDSEQKKSPPKQSPHPWGKLTKLGKTKDEEASPIAPRQRVDKPELKFESSKTKVNHDPLVDFLSSNDEDTVREGITLLKYAIDGSEEISSDIKSQLKRLSIVNPVMLSPLFQSEGHIREIRNLFTAEDYMRVHMLLMKNAEESFAILSSALLADEVYVSVDLLLSYILDLDNIVDDKALVMQIIKHKGVLLCLLLEFVGQAVSQIPITDINLTKLLNNLFEIVPVVHQTQLLPQYLQLLRILYSINTMLFSSQLASVPVANKMEIEQAVGIDDTLVYKNTDLTIANMLDFTQIQPGSNPENFSPLKNPSEFTMVMPPMDVASFDDTNPSTSHGSAELTALKLNTPPPMVAVTDDIEMEDCDDVPQEPIEGNNILKKSHIPELIVALTDLVSQEDNVPLMPGTPKSFSQQPEEQHVLGDESEHKPAAEHSMVVSQGESKLEPNVFQKESSVESEFYTRLHGTESKELAEGIAQVKLSNQSSAIETFIDKVDPLRSISNRSRQIPIFEDKQTGLPQKAKVYSYSDLNWFNFLMARLSLDPGWALEKTLSDVVFSLKDNSLADDDIPSVLSMIQGLDPVADKNELRRLEQAVWCYVSREGHDVMYAFMIVKQLLVIRYPLDLFQLWEFLVKSSYLCERGSLSVLDIALEEAFEETLCGLYSSSDLLSLIVHTLSAEHDTCAFPFLLHVLYKLVLASTLTLNINQELVSEVDRVLRAHLSSKRAEIRKLAVEIYGKLLKAAIADTQRDVSGCGNTHMDDILSSVTVAQRRMIEHFGR